jgi:two-component system catabolic regulation response regulator CreB
MAAMLPKPRILVVEDEPGIADTILYVLAQDGFEPVLCADAASALAVFAAAPPALAILDVGLPDCNGFELFRRLQALPGGASVPMLFLTARADEVDRVAGLELGADDYVAKPFSPRELSARVRTILRRSQRGETAAPQPSGPLVIDAPRRRATWYGQVLDLTRYEFGLLQVLAAHPGRVYTRDELLRLVWDASADSFDRTVDAHVKTLRAKLRAVAPEVDAILTSRGTGYALHDDLPPRLAA